MGVAEHREQAQKVRTVRYAQLTITDSRTEVEDGSGRVITSLLNEAGHEQVAYHLLPNEVSRIRAAVEELLTHEVDLIVMTGGTGLGRKDQTVEAISPLLEKEVTGFGELFRNLSYAEIGPAAFLSRALCGVVRGKIVVCLPGSEGAVRLALAKLLVPELLHLVSQVRR